VDSCRLDSRLCEAKITVINENPALRPSRRGLGNLRGEFSEVYEGSAWETLRARQGFLGSVRDFALFGLVLMLRPLHLLGKY
jgi:hypothetical protein